MKIVYIVSAMHYPNGMAKILTDKMNWLAEHTNHEIWMVETERADLPHHYPLHPNIRFINFDLNFDTIYSLPFIKRLLVYKTKELKFKKMLTSFLLELKADITISTLRREINFLHQIKDGSRKIGEIHFGRNYYRIFQKNIFPSFINSWITKCWQKQLIDRIKKLDKFVVLTHEDLKQWTELNNVIVIPNFIKQLPENISTCENKQVIALGRYTEQKGFDLLLQSWKIVEAKHPDWRLDIYGSGNHLSYQKLADSYLLSKVTCHPAVSDIESIYANASIYVLSSRYEGFGMVLIEAQSYGLPVVSFNCPCGPKDIISEASGILVENGNIQELANGIITLIEDEVKRIDMGKSGISNVARFRINEIMNNWVILFNNIVKS